MAPGDPFGAAKAHRYPAWLSRSFFTQRGVTLAFLPEARVMGEEPAYAFSPRASVCAGARTARAYQEVTAERARTTNTNE